MIFLERKLFYILYYCLSVVNNFKNKNMKNIYASNDLVDLEFMPSRAPHHMSGLVLRITNAQSFFDRLSSKSFFRITMKSFIEYSAQCEFPIQNLPYGVFSTSDDVSRDFFLTLILFFKLSFYFLVIIIAYRLNW